jgi:cephalosporin-C deacetylase-like acetyl esterase
MRFAYRRRIVPADAAIRYYPPMPRHATVFVAKLLMIVRVVAAQSPATTQASDWKFAATTDRADARYRISEPVRFRVTLMRHDVVEAGKTVEYRITKDGLDLISNGTTTSAAKPIELSASLDEPGFIRCELTYNDDDGKPVTGVVSAAVDPEQIKPSMPPPDDFDSFWKKQRELVESSPAVPQITPVDSGDADIEAFDVQVDCPGGAPLSAYLARPKQPKPQSLPIILYPHSAGVRSSDLGRAVRMAKLGAMCLDFNAHGIPNGKPDAFYTNLLNTKLKGYSRFNADDVEKIYFRGMLLRLLRAIQFTTTLPEWDGKTLIFIGSSQGGGQSLIGAGIEPRVTLCLASVPAMCDHTGFAAHRISGWPKLVKVEDGKPDAKQAQIARYFDAMTFATRIKCPVVVTVGYIDKVCPPTSVYAAFNAIGSKKRIIPRPTMAHEFPQDLQKEFDQIIREHIAAQQRR